MWKEAALSILFIATATTICLKLCQFLFNHHPGADTWIEVTLYFTLVACIDHLLFERLPPHPHTQLAEHRTDHLSGQPAPAAKAVAVQGELHYAEAEDHYVKLVFRSHVEHRRARFGDVINELGAAGHRVHKSFWVNCSVVKGCRRSGRRLMLVLADGVEIPIGRGNERFVLDALTSSAKEIRAGAEQASA
jgi:hypothetical protein